MYFGAASGRFGGWSDCDGWADPAILTEYTKPLGRPLGPAVVAANGSWVRGFASGTRVAVSPGGHPKGGGRMVHGQSCIWWADGTRLGSLCGPGGA